MRYILLLALLAFPALDVFITIQLAQCSRIPTLLWLAAGIVLGFMLLRSERLAFRSKTLASLSGAQPLLDSLLDSGRKVLAGILFIVPGVVSDCCALLLLALPINRKRFETIEIIEGKYQRLD